MSAPAVRIFSKRVVHCTLPQRPLLRTRGPPLRAHCQKGLYHTDQRGPPRLPRVTRGNSPKRSAIGPRTFLIAAVVSFAVAYGTLSWNTSKDDRQQDTEELQSIALSAQDILSLDLVMAPQQLPGRPGNLTPDQEAKLKEMWAQTLDLFGVSDEHEHTNGVAPSSASISNDSPEKKKKKGLMGRFKKDKADKDGDAAVGGVDNDKHGQVKEYEQALSSMTPEYIREAFWGMSKHDHPDALLLRFLRARKWDVHAAQVMALSTLHWRLKDMHVDDDIMIKGEEGAFKESKSSNAAEKKEGEDFLAQLRLGKSFLHGLDKDGRPCCYVRVRLHHGGEQSEKALERFTVYTIETARMMLRPPIDTATVVFDMTGFSMANMDYTPVKFMIKCFEANYPESLGSVLVYKSPWIFSGIWKIIKGWLDPVVAGKVHFVSNVQELEAFVPRTQIPKELDGDEAWQWSYVEPTEGENAIMEKTQERDQILSERKELVESYESETLAWVNGESGEGRHRIAQRMAENYWKLDPYIRARSQYDRTGEIGQDGRGTLNFYPKAAAATAGSNDDLD
ncbi:CRAL-TRIO domain-containing protein [Fulvia fulva]|uniref:CRAL-TRIO domain-containing protein n=1 Tax=Passalora fulva TaxID=5499 RepID=A0A9Q8PJI9_PASFU|nr:CRAL-TRIO domain-containing protein [Fulvia fulva]KAK4611816.1 CRAL-TRIO domain-containing protein [Fulvia fulva]KAK4613186.1 CRAL-TRIO domain-containing protein [Fulvia fulva]UJO23602.1 CRAL-TRIO domain-containing protein [Fulvia fulva]WPV21607.1 CRAL-TRIO domain-containing protein [Fulvia fulva]WPV36550.1 CRAL-TRIO domain-containing protein [Fulvia fulva]